MKIDDIALQLKRMPLLNETETHAFLTCLKEYLEKNRDLTDDELFSFIHDIRSSFFVYMNQEEKYFLVDLIIKYLKANGDLLPQLVEYSGLIYKYLSSKDRDNLFTNIIEVSEYLTKTSRGVVALTTFIKYTNKVYTTLQKEKVFALLNDIKKIQKSNLELNDTLEYIDHNLNRFFLPSKNDVLILIPEFLSGSSFLQPPLCALYSKQVLDGYGYSTQIFDNRVYNYDLNALTKLVGDNYKYIVVVSTPIDQIQNYFIDHRFVVFCQTVEAVKKHCKYRKLIVCGAHGTVDAKMLLNDISPDIIVSGEYDFRLPKIIDSLEKGDVNWDNSLASGTTNIFNNLDNNAYSKWRETPLDFSIIELENYFGYKYIKNTHVKKNRWAILQMSRGCPYNCTFCYNMYGKMVQFKDVQCIIQELQQLKMLGCEEVFFVDQTFTLDKKRVFELCEELKNRSIDISWQCETRVDLIDEQLILAMQQAGCHAIWLGIESFDENVLKKAQKGYRLEQLKQAFRILHKLDMEYHAFIMIGMEGENLDSLERTVSIIEEEHIKLSKSIIQCTPRPGTVYYSNLPDEVRSRINHFWQIDALRAYNDNAIPANVINNAVTRLMKVANEE